MVEGKLWALLIHAFDDKEKFLRARVFCARLTLFQLDRLVEALSEIHGTDCNWRAKDPTIWNGLSHILDSLHPLPFHTLRVMHFHQVLE